MWTALLTVSPAILGGCNVAGWVAQAIPQQVKATYVLPARSTLVLVDDPDRRLRDPSLPRYIATEISNALAQHRAVTRVVAPDKIDALMIELGGDFERTGIDQIGREVGAEQIVHVHVESATLYPEPGLLQPQAVVQIKVIDVVNRRRLFPATGRSYGRTEFSLSSRGVRLNVRLLPRGSTDESNAVQALLMRRLASRIARDSARLFHDYLPRQPGKPFE